MALEKKKVQIEEIKQAKEKKELKIPSFSLKFIILIKSSEYLFHQTIQQYWILLYDGWKMKN